MKIPSVIFLLLLLLINTCLCRDVNKLFEDINREYGKFNALAATLSWDSSVNPGNDLQAEAAKYQKELIIWQQMTCETLLTLYVRGLLNSTQIRQSYLLCRGPKFTYDEARLSSILYEKLQSIYSNGEVCVPIEKEINKNDPNAIEAAILNFLLSVKRDTKFESNDYIMYAVKLSVYSEMKKEKAFCIRGENDFQRMMSFSKIEEVLRWLWLVWREKVSPPMKEPYRKFVDIENQASRRNGYTDIGSSWRSDLEIKDLRSKCRRLYDNILPLYKMLHGVARFYLRKRYGEIVPKRGLIPAHLLGDLWSQNWQSLSELILRETVDLNYSIRENNWTVQHMVKRAEDYYLSLGLPPMTKTFWSKSVFERKNESVRCHGAAADMFKEGDFRMLYCLDLSMEDFYGLHHELGHIQYYMAYENQPTIFRQANAAFHETLGDTVMLGVMTPQHLHRLGLIDDETLYTVESDTRYEKHNSRMMERENILKQQEDTVSNYRRNEISCCVDRHNSGGDQSQRLEKNKANNCISCYKNQQVNNTRNNREVKGNKRINRKKYSYRDVEYNINKLKGYNIAKAENDLDLNINNMNPDKSDQGAIKMKLDHKMYKRDTDTLYDARREITIDPSQRINKVLYAVADDTTEPQINDYNPRGKFRNAKNVEIARDKLVRGEKNEDLIVNMNLDDILMFKQALNKIPQIPFALIIDEYRWKYFEGSLKDVNGDFWRMTSELQGIAPPGVRGEEYFDVAAKFHVPDNTPYIRYFLSSFLQHQLFETLCKAAVFGRRDPDEPLPDTISMNRCDIYGSKIVGNILKEFMSRGNSKHWRDILEEVTGERDVSAKALQRYYRPLYELLKTFVRKHNIPIGW